MKYRLLPLFSLLLFGQAACSYYLNSTKKHFKYEPEMQYIRGGSFMMGSPLTEKGRNDDERQHLVQVKSFWMAKTETTIAQWKACVKDSGCSKPHPYYDPWGDIDVNTPVNGVNLQDINEYIIWLNRKTGKHYRLPTEAEWEYAARAGSTSAYPWGDSVITFEDKYAKYNGKGQANCGYCKGEWASVSTSPVGSFPANGGLYDMIGNVAEWTCSAYDKNYSDDSELKCASPDDKRPRVERGGSYDSLIEHIRSATRWPVKISDSSEHRGFRLARTP